MLFAIIKEDSRHSNTMMAIEVEKAIAMNLLSKKKIIAAVIEHMSAVATTISSQLSVTSAIDVTDSMIIVQISTTITIVGTITVIVVTTIIATAMNVPWNFIIQNGDAFYNKLLHE